MKKQKIKNKSFQCPDNYQGSESRRTSGQKPKLWFAIGGLLLFFLQFNTKVFSASLAENSFVFCQINLEKTGNQDILGLIDEVLAKNSDGSVKNKLITDAISFVSIKDVMGYGLSYNSQDKLDYLLVVNLSNTFRMTIAGRTVEFDIKDKESLAGARTAALEKLLEKSLGKPENVKSVEILQKRIFFNEEKENREKIAAYVVMQDKVILATNKNFIKSFLKKNFPTVSKIQKFDKLKSKISLLKGGMILVDNKEGNLTKLCQKIKSEDKTQILAFISKISELGFFFEQIDTENIKGSLAVKAKNISNEEIDKEMALLKKYGQAELKREKELILVNFTVSKKWLEDNM